jgi:hypothetical protein
MEEIKFMFKSKLEQFKEQYPDLYDELYNEVLSNINKDKELNSKQRNIVFHSEHDSSENATDRCKFLIESGFKHVNIMNTISTWEDFINKYNEYNYNSLDYKELIFIIFNIESRVFSISTSLYYLENSKYFNYNKSIKL